ncbi:MAG: hypothetical protein ACRCVJ_01815 [Clostridium sp.]|uniref:hypothetical protein n=1 Tax=Clostridium sp. TaxID=1506 RepID=UPI003F4109C3
MANLNALELQNLRHLIGGHSTIEKKLQFYSEKCTDPVLKNMLKKDAEDAKKNRQKLISFLG